jgi:hypothetical protein
LFTNFCGITFLDWWRALRANRFAIERRFWRRAARITAGSLLNSWYRRCEDQAFGDQIDRVEVPSPLFILGHWRSGTTLLHNLLACDEHFAFPTLYETFFPHTFLLTEDRPGGLARRIVPGVPLTRGIDNVPMGLDMPYEDEFAIATVSLCSPYLLWAFPLADNEHDRPSAPKGASLPECAL